MSTLGKASLDSEAAPAKDVSVARNCEGNSNERKINDQKDSGKEE